MIENYSKIDTKPLNDDSLYHIVDELYGITNEYKEAIQYNHKKIAEILPFSQGDTGQVLGEQKKSLIDNLKQIIITLKDLHQELNINNEQLDKIT